MFPELYSLTLPILIVVQTNLTLDQWYPYHQCYANAISRWYANRHTSFFFAKNMFTVIVFTYWVLLTFCLIFVCFPCWFSKMTIIISHSHFVHVVFVSILVFQSSDRMTFGRRVFLEQGGTWWQYGADSQMVRHQKLFGNRSPRQTTFLFENFVPLPNLYFG